MDHIEADRIPMIETLFWPDTITRWEKEGLKSGTDLIEYFTLDRLKHYFGIFDHTLLVTPEIIEDHDNYRIRRDRYGAVYKEKKNSFDAAVMLTPAIRDRQDWNRVKDKLYVAESRFHERFVIEEAHKLSANGAFITIETIEPMWFALNNTMSYEHGLCLMACEPEFFEEVIAFYTDFIIGMLEICFEAGFRADALWFYSDMCYKTGPLFSPGSFRALAMGHLKRFRDFCDKYDLYLFWHCDGNIELLLPLLLEVGIDAIHPLEARAGNDVRELKKTYGSDLTFIGNINTDILAGGDRSAIEDEVASKVVAAKKGGGYIYHTDHSVPSTVSLETYIFTLEMVRKYGKY